MKKTTILRRLLAERKGKVIVKPSAYDAFSAKIIEAAGFKVVGVSGAALTAVLLGKPDAGYLSMIEVIMMSRYIANAISLPVIADADTGYGNALNVMRTTEEFIKAGVACIHIEDQVDPKRCGMTGGKILIPIEEAVGKYKAADKVRRELDPDFVLMARTDACGSVGGSLDEAITRANAYVEAGADMVSPDGIISEEDLVRFVKEVKAPIHFNRVGLSPKLHISRLEEIGVAIVSNPIGAINASGTAIQRYMDEFIKRDQDFLTEFSENAKGTIGENAHSFLSFCGFSEVRKLEEMFLPIEEITKKYKKSVGYKW